MRSLHVSTRIEQRLVSPIARDVKSKNLTYLSYRSLRNIEQCLRQVGKRNVPGVILEAGVALGGSAVIIAKLMPEGREFHGYDVFGMIPPPGEQDGVQARTRYETIASGESKGIGGEIYYGYRDNLYARVLETFSDYRLAVDGKHISLHRGLFEDTLDLAGKAVAFAHLDCDWYEPVKLCLDRIYPALSPGGFVISDDYYNYEGATRAVDEFVATHADMHTIASRRSPDRTTSLVLTKVS
jgi:O-methyltransferase